MAGESDSSVWSFLRAFTIRTLVLMSGAASVPIALIALFVPFPLLRVLFGALALVCGCFASYSVWRKEREEVGELRTQITSRRSAVQLRRELDALIAEATPIDKQLAIFRAIKFENDAKRQKELRKHLKVMVAWQRKVIAWLQAHMPEYSAEFDMPSQPRSDMSIEKWLYDRIKRLSDLKRIVHD